MRSHGITVIVLVFSLACNEAFSQEPEGQDDTESLHPLMDSKFLISAGVFFPDKSIELSARGFASPASQDIDFDESIGTSESENVAFFQFRWNFGSKWWMEAEYFNTDTDNSYVLDQDLTWKDLTFKEGSFARLGTDLEVVRLFFGRELLANRPKDRLAFGVGLHWMALEAFVEGDIDSNLGGTEFVRSDVDTGFPLPNFGVTYTRFLSPRWAFETRVDWLSISLDKYSGRLWNTNLGVDFAMTPNLGIGLRYMYFDLDGSIKDPPDWRGKADLVFDGLLLKLYAAW